MTIAPAVAKRVFQTSAFSQIFVGMSHLGVVLGVSSILLSNVIKTPLPWLRLGALLLPLAWIIPYDKPPQNQMDLAWTIALIFTPISFGWAAGDLALNRFIQEITAKEKVMDEISVLGAIMSFLYASYIVLYNTLSIVLGRIIDKDFIQDGNIKRALINVGGIQFAAISGFLLLNTLIPRGGFHLNPDILFDEPEKKQPPHPQQFPHYRPLPLTKSYRESADTNQTNQSDQQLVGQFRYE